MKNWEEALKISTDDGKPAIYLGQAATIAQTGDHGKAIKMVEETAKVPKIEGPEWVQAAAACALAAPAALKDSNLSLADQNATADRYIARALESLRRAKEDGFFKYAENRTLLDNLPEWNWLRRREEFKTFRKGLEPQ